MTNETPAQPVVFVISFSRTFLQLLRALLIVTTDSPSRMRDVIKTAVILDHAQGLYFVQVGASAPCSGYGHRIRYCMVASFTPVFVSYYNKPILNRNPRMFSTNTTCIVKKPVRSHKMCETVNKKLFVNHKLKHFCLVVET